MDTPTATIFLPWHAVDEVHQRGTRAAQPSAAAVVPGTLYAVTDEGSAIERSNGTAWQPYGATGGGGGGAVGDADTLDGLDSTDFMRKPMPVADLPAHHLTHEPGGVDAMAVDAAPAVGSLRTLGPGANQAAPGNDARFAAGMDLDYLGAYVPGTYNDGDIVVGSDGIAYLCVKDGTTTPPEAWPGAQTPVLHHLTHEPGGSDPMQVDGTPSIGSLRTLGTGANQAAAGNDARFATPAAHHASHEPGGADALANVAWVNLANVFTATPQTLSHATLPELRFIETGQAANLKAFRIVGNSQLLFVQTMNDAGVAVLSVLTMDRGGSVIVANNLTANGAGGNVACKNQANTFTTVQSISYANPHLGLNDTAAPADARFFRILNSAQKLYFQTLNDAQSLAPSIPLTLTRVGDAYVERDVYEKGRTVPMGHIQAMGFNPGNYWSTGGVWTVTAADTYYTEIGRTRFITRNIISSAITGAPASVLNMHVPPGGVAVAASAVGTAWINMGGVFEVMTVTITAGSGVITMQRNNNTAFPAVALAGMFSIAVIF